MTIQEFVQYVKSLEISTQAPSLGICECYPKPTVDIADEIVQKILSQPLRCFPLPLKKD